MIEQKSLKINFIMNAILTLSGFIFPLITFPYVSRILLPTGMGKVAMATSVVAYFALLARLGIPMYGIRACAGVRDDKQALSKMTHELFFINVLMGVVSYILFLGCLFSIPRLEEEKELYLIISTSIFFEALGVEWLYKALEEYTYITVRSIVFKFVAVIAMFFLIHEQSDYVVYGTITIFAASASNILNFYNLKKYIFFKKFENYSIRNHMKPILIFFATSCAIVIYTQLNTVMLGFMKTNADVGLYDSAMKIKNILVTIVTALGAVLLPRSSYYVKNGLYEEFAKVSSKAIHFVCLLALPLVVFFWTFADNGIYFLSGHRFDGAILPMRIVLPTIFFIGLTNVIGIQVFVPLGQEKAVLYSVVVGGLVDLVACVILIPKYAVIGAAFSNLLAEFAVLVVQMYLARNFRDIINITNALKSISFYKMIFALFLSIMVCYPIRIFSISNFFKLLIGGLIYFLVYFVILIMTKESGLEELYLSVLSKVRRVI